MAHATRYLLIITTTVLRLAQPSQQVTQYVDDPYSCAIIGEGDVYDTGVRLGYYFAWLSGLIAVGFNNTQAVRDARSFALLDWGLVQPIVMRAPFLVMAGTALTDQDDIPASWVEVLFDGIACG
ncbi:hypothetical protein BDV12DRAFT_196773 [Aspergillus spectabilis]